MFKMSFQFNLFLFVTSCLFFEAFPQRTLNTDCTFRGSNAFGVCKLITECPGAQDATKRATATICGFQGRTPIVCCEEKKKVIVNDNTFLDRDKNSGEGFIFPENNEYIWSQSNGVESIAEEKCREYSKSVVGVVNAVPLITDAEPVSIDVVKCDNNGLPLIVGGSPASPGEFPFMAVLGYSTSDGIGWFCGGTLISNNYVITAAHCGSTMYGEPVIVRLGEIDLKSDNDGTEYKDYNVEHVKVHEQYRPPSHNHDIALLKLSKKVTFTKYIRPACLWNKNKIDYNVSIATGWGKIGFVEDQSDKLLKVALDIFDNSICSRSYHSEPSKLPNGILSSMLCAGKLEGGQDTCQGDSGGPLIITKPKNRCVSYLIGVTSFGKGCGGANLPAVYTRVSHYLDWIAKHIW